MFLRRLHVRHDRHQGPGAGGVLPQRAGRPSSASTIPATAQSERPVRGRHDRRLGGGRAGGDRPGDQGAAGPGRLQHGRLDHAAGWRLARPDRVAGLVGIAAAPDFTEDLMLAPTPGRGDATTAARPGVSSSRRNTRRALSDHPRPDRGRRASTCCCAAPIAHRPARCGCCTACATPTCRGSARCAGGALRAPRRARDPDQGRRPPPVARAGSGAADANGRGPGHGPERENRRHALARRAAPSAPSGSPG